ELTGCAPHSNAPPPAFVEALFDQYADGFDRSLVGRLGYRVPELMSAAIARTGRQRFAQALDLGCGTGLMGERLRPICDRLAGYAISAEMLKRAEARGVYDRLVKADLQELSLPTGGANLVTAADVFMYLGALDGVFARIAASLAPSGLVAFSVEKHDGP